MSAHDWRASAALGYLRDSVASDRLVLFTGAGVSFGLKRAADPARSLPGWVELLRELFGHLAPRLDSTNRDDCDGLQTDGFRLDDRRGGAGGQGKNGARKQGGNRSAQHF